jgi:hypothetical protein
MLKDLVHPLAGFRVQRRNLVVWLGRFAHQELFVAAGKAVGTLHGGRHPGNLCRDETSCSST